MALTVEDGTGLSGADAYISVADVTAYLASYNPSTTWTALSSGDQEIIVRRKTQEIDGLFAGQWPGVIKSTTQALAWPRSHAYDAYGRQIGLAEVPTLIEWAVAEACKLAADGYELTPDRLTTDRAKSRELVKIGSLTFEDEWGEAGQGRDRYDRFDTIMGQILGAGAARSSSSISAINLGRS